ncbi:Outer membrane protein assembly factor BamB [BD1-7 clade bacterium]|uniref:Outer membrane protein assembly factor BamB n=1 Tax=BD1-7 clade bacterium TaxID=2029982 RepID=A0A5S9P9Q0_9GAMM|nr:Outer membrane protein assembly factor BamB [BD1-7 clade bacterium]
MIKRFNLKPLLAVFLILFISACGSTDKPKPTPLESFKPEVKLQYLWSRKIDELGVYFQKFEMLDDVSFIYVATEDGKIYQISKDDGSTGWDVKLPVPLTAGVGLDRERVYVGTLDGRLVALDKNTGEEVWQKQLSSEPVSPPSISEDLLVIHTNDGAVYALNTDNGEQLWKYSSNMPSLTIRGTSPAQFFANFVAVGLANGKLVILDRATGQARWENKVAIPQGDTEIERIVDVDARPLIMRDKLFAVSYQGRVVAYDLQNGRTLWAEDDSSYRDLAAGYGNLYVASSDGSLIAYDEDSGNIRWVQDALLYRQLTAPVLIGGYIAIADFNGYLHLLSQIDGHFVARKRIDFAPKGRWHNDRQWNVRRMLKPNSGVRVPVLVDGNRIFTLANDGSLKAFELFEIQ